ncbi:hypothetical protein TNCV_154601 [Trichonephila clavipes]|uniref:Uncharacterized protein n=1 Tax=Trichonephila clavipes TaxID=2585209 RepID=A0A8X6WI05_TRICX|nr:hypothetical protein TNCV_154601 [Trichonephila clavipes]
MSSFLVWRVKGILETGGVMDKCVQMLDKELWRLGPDGPGERENREIRRKRKRRGGDGKGERESRRRKKESGRERGARLAWRKWLSLEIGVKKTRNAGGAENRID